MPICVNGKMTVAQLIEELNNHDPNQDVTTWDAYGDRETTDCFITITDSGLHIGAVEIG